jgi:hypothetical protein
MVSRTYSRISPNPGTEGKLVVYVAVMAIP